MQVEADLEKLGIELSDSDKDDAEDDGNQPVIAPSSSPRNAPQRIKRRGAPNVRRRPV